MIKSLLLNPRFWKWAVLSKLISIGTTSFFYGAKEGVSQTRFTLSIIVATICLFGIVVWAGMALTPTSSDEGPFGFDDDP